MSSSKMFSNDLSKPPTRVSPMRRSPNRQVTPKRLASPTCLRNYAPRDSQEFSPQSKGESREKSGTTKLSFPTSPTKLTFSNENKIGGDGSLSKLRSRFSNGLLSPQRLSLSNGYSDLKGKNLLNKLHDLEDIPPKDDTKPSTSESSSKNDSNSGPEGRVTKRQPKKKTVKFELPSSQKEFRIESELREIKNLLLQVVKQQKDLESRMVTIENCFSRNKER